MEDVKALTLFREIRDKTMSRKLAWEPTAIEGVFVVPLKGKYLLKAFEFTDYAGSPTRGTGPPSFTLFEGDDLIVDTNFRIEGIGERDLKDLYMNVKRQALRTDQKIDDAISELKSL
jgi:hypothetical protein